MKTRLHTISMRFLSLLLLFGMVPLAPAQAYFAAEQAASAVVRAAELELSVGLSESAGRLGAIRPPFASDFGLQQTVKSVASEVMLTATTTGDSDFCDALTLMVDTGSDSQLGSVTGFSFGPIAGTSSLQVVDVRFALPESSLSSVPHGAGCAVTLLVNGSQAGSTTGFSDSRALTWQLAAEQVVLNEVLADPATGQVEFIELANVGSTAVDVAGWTITEQTGSGAETAHDIVATSSAASDLIAYDDSDSTVVPAGGQLALKFAGNAQYLNNDGDTITLLDASATQLDSYTYTTSLTGKSDARIPDGTGDWIDPIPTPGTSNKLETSLSELSVQLSITATATQSTAPSDTTGGGGGNPTGTTVPSDVGSTSEASLTDSRATSSTNGFGSAASTSADSTPEPAAATTSAPAEGFAASSTQASTSDPAVSAAQPTKSTSTASSGPVKEPAQEETVVVDPVEPGKPEDAEETPAPAEETLETPQAPAEPDPAPEPESEEPAEKEEEPAKEVTEDTEAV